MGKKKPSSNPAANLDATWDTATRGPRASNVTGRVIFKYQMPVLESFSMKLPVGAEIIREGNSINHGLAEQWPLVPRKAERNHPALFEDAA